MWLVLKFVFPSLYLKAMQEICIPKHDLLLSDFAIYLFKLISKAFLIAVYAYCLIPARFSEDLSLPPSCYDFFFRSFLFTSNYVYLLKRFKLIANE